MSVVRSLFPEDEDLTLDDNDDAVDHSRLGRFAEFQVCAELTRLGYYVSHIDAPGFDVLLVADGRSYRVQVKSSSVVHQGKCRWRCRVHIGSGRGKEARARSITRQDADLLALYHHQFDRVVFLPVTDASVENVLLPINQVTQVEPLDSLRFALSALS